MNVLVHVCAHSSFSNCVRCAFVTYFHKPKIITSTNEHQFACVCMKTKLVHNHWVQRACELNAHNVFTMLLLQLKWVIKCDRMNLHKNEIVKCNKEKDFLWVFFWVERLLSFGSHNSSFAHHFVKMKDGTQRHSTYFSIAIVTKLRMPFKIKISILYFIGWMCNTTSRCEERTAKLYQLYCMKKREKRLSAKRRETQKKTMNCSILLPKNSTFFTQ